jgi:RNA-binding protein
MANLNPKQRQFLKGLAHALKPLFHIGKEGVTDTVRQSIQNAFNNRELLKVKVLDAAPENAAASGEQIAAGLDRVEVVQVIGKTVVLYRPHPEKPKIKLPDSKSPRA